MHVTDPRDDDLALAPDEYAGRPAPFTAGAALARPPAPTTAAFRFAAVTALLLGAGGIAVGLWNAAMALHEKGYYFALLLFGLFAAVSLQKTVRDRLEGVPTTDLYYGLCWVALGSAIALTVVGLWNAALLPSEKGFYVMAYALALFGAITVQKNVRDTRG
jgi:uncharacterized membrane protein YiaA